MLERWGMEEWPSVALPESSVEVEVNEERLLKGVGDRLDWAISSIQRPASKVLPGPNDDRDSFILEKYLENVPLKKILASVNETKGWARLASETAVSRAMVRYCAKHRLYKPARKTMINRRK